MSDEIRYSHLATQNPQLFRSLEELDHSAERVGGQEATPGVFTATDLEHANKIAPGMTQLLGAAVGNATADALAQALDVVRHNAGGVNRRPGSAPVPPRPRFPDMDPIDARSQLIRMENSQDHGVQNFNMVRRAVDRGLTSYAEGVDTFRSILQGVGYNNTDEAQDMFRAITHAAERGIHASYSELGAIARDQANAENDDDHAAQNFRIILDTAINTGSNVHNVSEAFRTVLRANGYNETDGTQATFRALARMLPAAPIRELAEHFSSIRGAENDEAHARQNIQLVYRAHVATGYSMHELTSEFVRILRRVGYNSTDDAQDLFRAMYRM